MSHRCRSVGPPGTRAWEDDAVGNALQANHIARFHRHLQRLGFAGGMDETARLWIRRYAKLWRARYEAGGCASH